MRLGLYSAAVTVAVLLTRSFVAWAALPPGSCPPGDWGTLDGPCRSNPGPFNVKEHANVTMMTAAGSTVNYAVDILLA